MARSSIAQYRITNLLGTGPFGITFLAEDTNLDREVVLKLSASHPALLDSSDGADQWLIGEGKVLAKLNHPGIVTVYEVDQFEGQAFLAVEYIDGTTLLDVFRSKEMQQERLLSILADAANAIDYVHRRGYLHLHLKPSNILIDGSGRTKIDGFRFALEESEKENRGDQIVGTLPYMAPEQVTGASDQLGPHTDIWAMGILMFESLFGQRPFFGEDYHELIEQINDAEPVFDRAGYPDVSNALCQICSTCLAKSPTDRYDSLQEFESAVRATIDSHRGGAQKRAPTVFISHSSHDRNFVESEIVSFLERHDIKTWYSRTSISSASYWERVILNGLKTNEWFLLVMSPNSMTSEWVKDEVFWAIENRHQRIVPVMMEPCDPREFHLRIGRLQHIDFSSDRDMARTELLQAFNKDLA